MEIRDQNPNPPPHSKRTSVGGFVEGILFSTFLFVTMTRVPVLTNRHQECWEKLHTLTPSLCCDKKAVFLKG